MYTKQELERMKARTEINRAKWEFRFLSRSYQFLHETDKAKCRAMVYALMSEAQDLQEQIDRLTIGE